MPQPKHISVNDEPTMPYVDVKFGAHQQMSSAYKRNPMFKKNTKMWTKIIHGLQSRYQPRYHRPQPQSQAPSSRAEATTQISVI